MSSYKRDQHISDRDRGDVKRRRIDGSSSSNSSSSSGSSSNIIDKIQLRKEVQSKMTEEELLEAARLERIAQRAEEKALARAKEKKKGIADAENDGMRKPDTNEGVKFMTKKQRQESALKRLEEKRIKMEHERVSRQKARDQYEYRSRHALLNNLSSSSSNSSSRASSRGHTSSSEDKTKQNTTTTNKETAITSDELKAIQDHYLGKPKKKKKIVKASEKFSKIFQFDWDATDDTSKDSNPLYSNTHKGALQFGRGYRAGIDMKEQRKSNNFLEDLVGRRNNINKNNNSSNNESVALLDAKKKKDNDEERGGYGMNKHWSDKELHAMNQRDWRIFREDYDIRIQGGRATLPLRYWKESSIHKNILKGISDMGFTDPSPIQRQAIPIGLKQRDLIGIAETGSGKTAAFVIPMLTYILSLSDAVRESVVEHGPLCLIMAPARELVAQIEAEAVKIAKYCDIRCMSIVGGMSIEDQGMQIQRGMDIVVATPGRLKDCIESRYVVLNQCNYVVLDEADRMIDMGFEPQVNFVMDAMGSLMKDENEDEAYRQEEDGEGMGLRNYRTTIMFSATMPPSVERIAKTYLRHPVIVAIGDQDSMKNKRIEQRVLWCSEAGKKKELTKALNLTAAPIIVFVNLKKTCDSLSRLIEGKGYRVATLHGGKRQDEREVALDIFRSGDADVLCATDVAGRGLDVKGIQHVINYDMPSEIDRYCHRIGRTGRAGLDGIATTFLTEGDEEVFFGLKNYLESTDQRIPSELARHPAANTKPGDVMRKRRDNVQFL